MLRQYLLGKTNTVLVFVSCSKATISPKQSTGHYTPPQHRAHSRPRILRSNFLPCSLAMSAHIKTASCQSAGPEGSKRVQRASVASQDTAVPRELAGPRRSHSVDQQPWETIEGTTCRAPMSATQSILAVHGGRGLHHRTRPTQYTNPHLAVDVEHLKAYPTQGTSVSLIESSSASLHKTCGECHAKALKYLLKIIPELPESAALMVGGVVVESRSIIPCPRTQSNEHRLNHVSIAATAGVCHVLCTARGEVSRAPLAVLQALSTAPSFKHTAFTHEPTLHNSRKIDDVQRSHTRRVLGALQQRLALRRR